MQMSKNLNPGDTIEIQIIRKDNELIALKSTIYELLSDVLLNIAMPSYMGRLFPITNGTRVYIIDNVENRGIYTFYAFVRAKDTSASLATLTIERISDIKKSQRRKFYRVPYFKDLTFKLPIAEEDRVVDEKLLEKYKDNPNILIEADEFEIIKATTRDLSGGGFRFSASKNFKLGDILNGEMEIEGSNINFSVVILRIVKDVLYDNLFEIGCSFVDIDEVDRSKIIGLIFKKQRDIVKKGLI
ncbi:MAG: PilZ domain-containing protein [Acidaminobacteraceae bacterium]